ncbi:MAG TPA: Ni/Fe hydrogenase subunit alpha [bacterium]
MPRTATRHIKVNYLARVEGEGGLDIRIRGRDVKDVKLRIVEPPRFFEALLRGRDFREAPDLTARICGICPVAYQMCAVHAMEQICGVTVDGPLRALRRLLYCGEWIESHVLHMFLLHAPDFLGYQDAVQMAKDHPELVQRGLRMKKAGNTLMTLLGGREIHPINVKIGGFYRVPTKSELAVMRDELAWGRDAAVKTMSWLATLSYPDFEQDYEFVALRHAEEYPLNEGRLVSNKGLDIEVRDYDAHLLEQHQPHSTALHSVVQGRGTAHVGPLARYSLNFERLPSVAQDAARQAGLSDSCRNPFRSILVRGVETVFAFEEALRIIEAYEPPDAPAVEVRPRAGTGYAVTEAPRGILYHRYTIDDAGTIRDAKIVSPTAVNQATIEQDLRAFVPERLSLPAKELEWQCEQAVRNYDPCISCSTHFLKLRLFRE